MACTKTSRVLRERVHVAPKTFHFGMYNSRDLTGPVIGSVPIFIHTMLIWFSPIVSTWYLIMLTHAPLATTMLSVNAPLSTASVAGIPHSSCCASQDAVSGMASWGDSIAEPSVPSITFTIYLYSQLLSSMWPETASHRQRQYPLRQVHILPQQKNSPIALTTLSNPLLPKVQSVPSLHNRCRTCPMFHIAMPILLQVSQWWA